MVGLWPSDSPQVLGGGQAMTSEGRGGHILEGMQRDVRRSDNHEDHLLYIFA